MDINTIFQGLAHLVPPSTLNIAVAFLAFMGSIDLFLGVISKNTPWKWDDNLYSIVHEVVTNLPILGNKE